MAAPAVVGETAVSSTLASFLSPPSPSPCPRLKSRPPIPPSTVRLSSRPRSRSLRLSACPPSRHPVAACLKSSPSLGLPKEEDEPSIDDNASPPPPPPPSKHMTNTLEYENAQKMASTKPVGPSIILGRGIAEAIRPATDRDEEVAIVEGGSHDHAKKRQETTLDMKLPRRSLLVLFTCNSCGERTRRLINRVAYERGTVFVQCAGCLVHHKLVDNLNLVVEYDLRDDTDTLDPAQQDGELA